MKKRSKKILAIFVSVMMAFIFTTGTVFAEVLEADDIEAVEDKATVEEISDDDTESESIQNETKEELITNEEITNSEEAMDEEVEKMDNEQTLEGLVPKCVYEKVSAIDDTNAKYLIVYGDKALNNKGNSKYNGTTMKIKDREDKYYDITNVDNTLLWSFSKKVNSRSTKVKISNVSGGILEVNDGSISMSSQGDDLVVNYGNEKFKISYDRFPFKDNYLVYNKYFYGQRSYDELSNSSLDVYKQVKMNSATVTSNFYVNGELIKGGITQKVDYLGKDTVVTLSKPSEITADCSFEKVTINGEKSDKLSYEITVSGDTEVNYYYVKHGEKDIKLSKTATRTNSDKVGTYDIKIGVQGIEVQQGAPVDVTVVVDESSSMNKGGRMETTKKALNTFIDTVMPEDEITNVRMSFVTYSGSSRAYSFDNNKYIGSVSQKNYYTDNNAEAKEAVRAMNANGGTYTVYGFDMAEKVIATRNRDDAESIVIFMTDGVPTGPEGEGSYANEIDFNSAVDKAIELSKNNIIYTVGLLTGFENDPKSIEVADSLLSSYAIYNAIKISGNSNGTSTANIEVKSKPGYAKKYYRITDEKQADSQMSSIYKEIAYKTLTLAKGDVTDIIPSEYKLTSDSREKLIEAGCIISEAPKETTLVFKNVLAGKDVENLPIFTVEAVSDKYGSKYTNTSAVYDYILYNGEAGRKKFEMPIGLINPKTEKDEYWTKVGENYAISNILNNDPSYKAGKIEEGNYQVSELQYVMVDSEGNELSKEQLKEQYPFLTVNEDKTLNFREDVSGDYEFYYIAKANVNKKDESVVNEGENVNSQILKSQATKVIIHVYEIGNKAFVIDYGKPVTYYKDKVFDSNFEKMSEVSIALDDGNGKCGNLSYENENITYTPNRFMDKIDKFNFTLAKSFTNTAKATLNKEVSMIPATTVYYEDNFATGDNTDTTTGIVFSGDWKTVDNNGNEISDLPVKGSQDNKVTKDHPYGYDDGYAGDLGFSNGSAKVIVGNAKDTKASFTFKGTGFDLISRTDNVTGTILLRVYGKDTEGNKVKEKILVINTKCNSNTLYQIPVLNAYDLPYGEHEVEITVLKGQKFYFDGLRIYNPLGTNNEFANAQYGKDRELNARYEEIRNILINSDTFNAGEVNSGAVFVDSRVLNEEGQKTSDIDTYKTDGPKNEVYLSKGQSIGFKIAYKGDASLLASVQVGLKAPQGEKALVKVGSGSEQLRTIELNTATDMYYDITKDIKFDYNSDTSQYEGIIVVNNPELNNENEGLLAITNLKLTFNSNNVDHNIFSDIQVLETVKAVNTTFLEGEEEVAVGVSNEIVVQDEIENQEDKEEPKATEVQEESLNNSQKKVQAPTSAEPYLIGFIKGAVKRCVGWMWP